MRARYALLLLILACGTTAPMQAATATSECIDGRGQACVVLAMGVYAERLAVDTNDVYWLALSTSTGGGSVGAVSKSGGSTRTVTTTTLAPLAIAADDSGLFFSLGGSSEARYADGSIGTVDTSVGTATILAAIGQSPEWLALDASNVYATTSVANVEDRVPIAVGLFSVPRGGGNATTLVNGEADVVAADSTGIYWSGASPTNAQALGVYELAAGTTSVVQLAPHSTILRLVVDDTNVYFVVYGAQSSIMTVPKGGGSATTLYVDDYVQAIAVDGSSLYALLAGDATASTGRIVRMPKPGGAASVFAERLSYPTDIVLDDGYVYCADFNAAAIVKIAK